MCAFALILFGFGFLSQQKRHEAIFDGSNVKNQDHYDLSFKIMNEEDSHVFTCGEGDEIKVDFSIEKGNVDILVAMEEEKPLYKGNQVDQASFSLIVPKDGDYVITVKAEHAAGNLSFELVKE
mgnify:CR=1 FL=1